MYSCKEQEVALKLGVFLAKNFKGECNLVGIEGDTFVNVSSKHFELLFTVCDTNKKTCIKIEEILVKKPYRNKGLCTEIMKTIKTVAKIEQITIGLWCDKNNKRLFNFYSRLGFRYIETLDDDWLEYN